MKRAIVPSRIPGIHFSLNPYVGCGFGCRFCYASYISRYVGEVPSRWGDFAFPKEGFIDALVNQLRKPEKFSGKTIIMGSVMDPYQPLESRYRLTKEVLEVFREMAPDVRLKILTRSLLILRDLELLKGLNVDVSLSISVMKDEYFRQVEPYSPPVSARMDVLKKLIANGIESSAFVAPVFPDAIHELEEILGLLRKNGIPVMLFELLAPYKNPRLKEHPLYRRWSNGVRTPGIFDRFSSVIHKYYPEVHIVRHGWK